MNKVIRKILQAANNAYENGECQVDVPCEDIGAARGDTLAEFLHIEIREVCNGNPESEMVQIVANAISSAIEQLQAVEAAIIELDQ
jgi:hypothetical protein